MKMNRFAQLCLYLLLALGCLIVFSSSMVACGEPTAPTENTAGDGGTGDGGTADTSGEKTWPQMSFDEKRAFMSSKVMPAMKAIFQAHDATKYANFGCATCHGADMQERKFAMPNKVYPLQENGINNENADWLKLMREKVQPEMAKLLGTKQYSCFGCHATKP